MARLRSVALLVLVAAAAARAQDIVDNPAPKNGDVCKDAGDQWRNIKLGPCEAGTKCQAYKRGERPGPGAGREREEGRAFGGVRHAARSARAPLQSTQPLLQSTWSPWPRAHPPPPPGALHNWG